MAVEPIIVVHGGAAMFASDSSSTIDDYIQEQRRNGVKEAAKVAWRLLKDNQSAVNAVEAAVTALEDSSYFNAGKGAALAASGHVELEASVMEGKSLRCGAVMRLSNIKNPVQVALKGLMDPSAPTVLCGDGAKRFAASNGFEMFPEEYFVNEKQVEWDGVGAIAIDTEGNVACASSSGGKTGKILGHIGDVAIIGSSMYCDNDLGAVMASGGGDSFIRTNISSRVLQRMILLGQSPQVAVDEGLSFIQLKTGSQGALIAINMDREVGIAFDGGHLAWAYIKDDTKLYHGMIKHEHVIDKL